MNKKFARQVVDEKGALHILVLIAVIGLVAFLSLSSFAPFKNYLFATLFQRPSSYAAGLPIPTSIKIEPDDRTAILKWDNHDTLWPLNGKPAGVFGYVIYWGTFDSSSGTITNPQSKLTEDTAIQLQPLTDGVKYGAYIQSVDSLGSVSVPSSIITFQSDPSRVNSLRTQMNGFFDDFNVPAGAFDDLKWNWALSACAGSGGNGALDGQFINAQFHSHNQSYSQYCDRSQNVSRPRAVFDFTPGIARPNTNSGYDDSQYGTVVFDFDGPQGRDRWYLDLYDVANGLIDVPSRASDDGGIAQSPYNNIRIVQPSPGSLPEIKKVDEKGFIWNGITTPGVQLTCDLTCGVTTNVRNHWVIKVSKQRIIILINGKVAADVSGWTESSGDHTTGLNLPYSKAYLLWVQFSYNTPKADMPSSLIHWDNFGFNAPTGTAPSTETHNYIDGNIGVPVANPCHVGNGPPATLCANGTTTIKIPDSMSGASSARLMFIASGEIAWNSTDYILLNGHKLSIPDPKTLPLNIPLGTPQRVMDGITPLQYVMPINLADLINGDNKVQLVSNNFGMLDIHIELDFPKTNSPSYTQPTKIWNFNPSPTKYGNGFSEIPNHIGIGTVHGVDKNGTLAAWQVWNFPEYVLRADSGGNEPAGSLDPCGWCSRTKIQMSPYEPIYQTGTVKFDFNSTGALTLFGTGSYSGHQAYQVWVDRQKVFEQKTNATVPAPGLSASYSWDTTKVCNGAHQVFIESYTPSGMPSQASAPHANITPGNYSPLTIYTKNTSQTNCPGYQIHAGYNNIVDENNGTNWEPVSFNGGTIIDQWNYGDAFYEFSSVGNQSYSFSNIPNGSYDVTLKFAETQGKTAGQRVFNVSLSGNQVLTNFDIMASSNGTGKVDKKFTINVTSGTIPVQFSSVVGEPIITAIQAVPTGTIYTPLTFSLNSTPSPSVQKTGDINNDGAVNAVDFAILLSKWGSTDPIADLNNDGTVGLVDFSILLSKWGS